MQVISFSADGVAADPYMSNVIRIERVCIATALYTLMKYVGIEEGIFCADDSPSPFYRPSLEFADDATRDRTIGMVQQMFKTLKPDLRPIAEQITVEHHPYIDILPFPTLRRNLIMHQNEIDEDEFLNDTLTGLVCWGGAGTTKRDPDSVTGHAVTGNLWDVRSWEAKVWFLKKYWWLLGGEEGELVRQSEWWRSVRGEEAKIDLDESMYNNTSTAQGPPSPEEMFNIISDYGLSGPPLEKFYSPSGFGTLGVHYGQTFFASGRELASDTPAFDIPEKAMDTTSSSESTSGSESDDEFYDSWHGCTLEDRDGGGYVVLSPDGTRLVECDDQIKCLRTCEEYPEGKEFIPREEVLSFRVLARCHHLMNGL
ncbi:hypothetical protein TrVFT333_009532 [Trichoderma virens FT-333]|nr:hypothetical protein TrVFT333_009532 [Trichoderma virens FT-333]